jgi:hypothetical protein
MIRRGIGRVGRPSVVGTVARTAVVAGTATAVVGGVSKHQQAKAQEAAQAQASQQEQQQAAAPPPPPPAAAPAASDDPVAQLERLAALKQQGILTDAEFEAQKAKILGS